MVASPLRPSYRPPTPHMKSPMGLDSHSDKYLDAVVRVVQSLDRKAYEKLVDELVALKAREGRLFILGVGGSAANAGHAVNDFRKLCGIEAYAPTDNVSELTARTNDEGWATVFAAWLEVSRIRPADAILVLSVGGGDAARNVSPNLVQAIDLARRVGARVLGLVGRDGGHTARVGDAVVIVPTVDDALITPLSEAFQAVLWHGLVSHPRLAAGKAKWESMR